MKKTLIAAALLIALASCGSGTSNEARGKDADSSYKSIGGVENANGNIPDTTATGATPRSGNPPKDSSRMDSAH